MTSVGGQVQAGVARPSVSIVIPCLDEEKFIRRTLDDLLGGGYEGPIEAIVVDGGSTDSTREIVAEAAAADPRIRLLDNPRRVTPVALNIGIGAARGEVIVRADVHCEYPPGFVSALVTALETSGADMVGASSENVPSEPTRICEAISIATDSPFGTGSRFRYHRESGPVDCVQLGCWRRELFDRVGLFDERLLRNQDNEHSSRILRNGGRLWMTADVRIRYFPRSTVRALCRQAEANGRWNAFTERLHPYTFRWRHFLPSLFFLGVCAAVLLLVAGAALGAPLLAGLAAAIVVPYLTANLAFSVVGCASRGRLALAPLVSAVLASYHFAYGFGIARGWLLVATGRWRAHLGGRRQEARPG